MLQQNTEGKKWDEMYIMQIFIIICELASFVVGIKY